MKLHQDKQTFKEAIEATAQHFQMRPVFIEKDYWVTYVLKNLSLSVYAENIIFKGGTSLSKAYQCIARFSEDIDLAVLSPGDYTGSQLKGLLKDVTECITQGITNVVGHTAEKKMGRMRATVYSYDKLIEGADFGVVKDYILIEINCFTDPVPYNVIPIESYIAQFFNETENKALIVRHELSPVAIKVLSLERTFFEKLLSVNRLSYEGTTSLLEKIRHFYDLHQLFYYPPLAGKILIQENMGILANALKDDEANRTMGGAWQGQRLQDSPLFSQLEDQWTSLTPGYTLGLADLIWIGELPKPAAVLAVLQAIKAFVVAFDEQNPPTIIPPVGN